MAAALAILLWPEAEAERADVAMALDAVPARAVPPADRQLGSICTEQFPSPAHAGARAPNARLRLSIAGPDSDPDFACRCAT